MPEGMAKIKEAAILYNNFGSGCLKNNNLKCTQILNI